VCWRSATSTSRISGRGAPLQPVAVRCQVLALVDVSVRDQREQVFNNARAEHFAFDNPQHIVVGVGDRQREHR
jgi:hypothetical protein